MVDNANNTKVAKAILERLNEAVSETEDRRLPLGKIIASFGDASFVPAMLVPAIIVVSPLSGIPFLSSTMGLTIALVAVQLVVGREHLWLPRRLQRLSVRRDLLRRGIKRLETGADWLDQRLRRRWAALTATPINRLIAGLCMLCGLAMPFLELVPFSSSILGAAVICFGSGLLSRDGLLVVFGFGFMGVATLVPLAAYTLFGQALSF